jgi:hypothetical protein
LPTVPSESAGRRRINFFNGETIMERLNLEREIAGINYGVRELTVEEIRLWLVRMEQAYTEPRPQRPGLGRRVAILLGFVKEAPAGAWDVVSTLLFDDLTMLDLSILTTLTREQIGALTPAQLREVWIACQEVNTDFFAFRRRLEQIGMASREMSAAISNVLSPA